MLEEASVKLRFTQSIAERALRDNSRKCLVAEAIKEALPEAIDVDVAVEGIYWVEPDGRYVLEAVPPDLIDIIWMWEKAREEVKFPINCIFEYIIRGEPRVDPIAVKEQATEVNEATFNKIVTPVEHLPTNLHVTPPQSNSESRIDTVTMKEPIAKTLEQSDDTNISNDQEEPKVEVRHHERKPRKKSDDGKKRQNGFAFRRARVQELKIQMLERQQNGQLSEDSEPIIGDAQYARIFGARIFS